MKHITKHYIFLLYFLHFLKHTLPSGSPPPHRFINIVITEHLRMQSHLNHKNAFVHPSMTTTYEPNYESLSCRASIFLSVCILILLLPRSILCN